MSAGDLALGLRRAALLLLAGAAALGSACRSPEPADAPQHAVHAVHTERLEAVMRQMERVDGALLPPELDLGPEQQRRRDEVARLAGFVAQSAHGIPQVLGDTVLPAEYRDAFVQLALDLEDRAVRLQEAARDPRVVDLAPLLTSMHETCTECHTRFRVLPAAR